MYERDVIDNEECVSEFVGDVLGSVPTLLQVIFASAALDWATREDCVPQILGRGMDSVGEEEEEGGHHNYLPTDWPANPSVPPSLSSSAPPPPSPESSQPDLSHFFTLQCINVRSAPRFKVEVMTFELNLINMENCPDSDATLHAGMSAIIERAFLSAPEGSKVGIRVRGPGLRQDVCVPFMKKEVLTSEKMIMTLERFIRSCDNAYIDESSTIEATRIDPL